MLNMDTLKAGDKIRRLVQHNYADVGQVFEVAELGYDSGMLTVKNSPLGLAEPKNWELVVEETTLSELYAKLAEIHKQAAEVLKEIAEVEQRKESKGTSRAAVIAKAKAEVEAEIARRERNYLTPIEFHVNERKGTVVALRRGSIGNIITKGLAKVSRDDKFDENIGKVIAMRRALGHGDDPTYLNAPQN